MEKLDRNAKSEVYAAIKMIIFNIIMVIVGTLLKDRVGATIIDADVDTYFGYCFIFLGIFFQLVCVAWAIELKMKYNEWKKAGNTGLFRRPWSLR
jgi:hypothetical protein